MFWIGSLIEKKFLAGNFRTLIDQWDINSTRYNSISISRLRDSDNRGVTFTDLEIHFEEICGKYMDEHSFSRSYKSTNLSSDEVENELGFEYLINRYKLAANGKDPRPAYFTDPIDFERKIN